MDTHETPKIKKPIRVFSTAHSENCSDIKPQALQFEQNEQVEYLKSIDEVFRADRSCREWIEWAQKQIDKEVNDIKDFHKLNQKLKKRKCAYKLFKIDTVIKLKQENPNCGFKERADIVKGMWKSLSDAEKQLYVIRSRK